MTKQDTMKAIRSWDMSVSFKNGEYRVSHTVANMPKASRREATAYYTTDAKDAVDTARAMAREVGNAY